MATAAARRPGRPLKYPWDKVAQKQRPTKFTIAALTVSESAFRSAASAYAGRHGLKAHIVKKDEETLLVSFTAADAE